MGRVEQHGGEEPPGAPGSNDEAWVNNPVPQFRCGQGLWTGSTKGTEVRGHTEPATPTPIANLWGQQWQHSAEAGLQQEQRTEMSQDCLEGLAQLPQV